MGFPHLGEVSLSEGAPPPSLGVLLLEGWTSARQGFSEPPGGLPSFSLWWSFREDTTLAVNSSIHSGPQGGKPGSLLSLYT